MINGVDLDDFKGRYKPINDGLQWLCDLVSLVELWSRRVNGDIEPQYQDTQIARHKGDNTMQDMVIGYMYITMNNPAQDEKPAKDYGQWINQTQWNNQATGGIK